MRKENDVPKDMKGNYVFGSATMQHLDQLARKTGAKDPIEVLSAALAFYTWAVKQQESGFEIAAVNEGKDLAHFIRLPKSNGGK